MSCATATHDRNGPSASGALRPDRARRSGAAVLWAWILVAMVLAQTLGFTHGVLHSVAPVQVHHLADAAPALPDRDHLAAGNTSHAAPQADGGAHWLTGLFGGHGAAGECRLFDQIGHGDGLPAVPALGITALALPLFQPVFEAALPLAPAALVQARGPPRLR